MPRRAANCTGVVGWLRHRVATRKVARLMAVACSPPPSRQQPPPPHRPSSWGDPRRWTRRYNPRTLSLSLSVSLSLSACLPLSVSLSACLSLSVCQSLNASIELVNSISVLIYAIISMWPSVSVKFGLGLPTCFFGSKCDLCNHPGNSASLSISDCSVPFLAVLRPCWSTVYLLHECSTVL